MSALPILYSFRRCPYAMRARMALDASELVVEHREVLLRDKPAEMLAASPKGTVPVLVMPDGTVIDESLDIMIVVLRRHDPEDWLQTERQDRAEADAFLAKFKPALDRYKYPNRYDPKAARGDVDLTQRETALSLIETHLGALTQTPFLRGARPQLIDVALFPFLRQFAAVEPDWWSDASPTGVRDWLSKWLAEPRFIRIMAKHPVWSE